MFDFYWPLNWPIWPGQLQLFVIGQVKADNLNLEQPIKPEVKALNNQSYSSILLLAQLEI